ncbi:MAG: UvrD-helicase domain-containing protein [Oscillospiraceae bacterium]|nr:UvrD-helicase domain-containing protein [Oscillospiraceae bacterium]
MINFTDNQTAAIQRIEGDVYVSAAAGSGKTAVLVERIVGILSDQDNKVEADSLLVVTFTRAAAAEMSSRIKLRLQQLLKESDGNTWLKHQINLIKQANISTIHAFCMSLLREFWNELDLPNDFSIVDEFTLADMKLNAKSAAAERLYSGDSGFEAYSDLFGRARTDETALKTVDLFMSFLSDIASPKAWCTEFSRRINNDGSITESDVAVLMMEYTKESIEAAASMLQTAIDIAKKDEELYNAYSEALYEDIDFIEELTEITEDDDWDGCIEKLESYSPLRLRSSRKADKTLSETAKFLRDKAKKMLQHDILSRYFPITEQEFSSDQKIVAEAFTGLLKGYEIYEEELTKLKKRYKMFEYSDLERYTIALLEQNDTIRAEVNSRYKHILVDEYQDTNEVQSKLFSLLKGDNGIMFAVGDVKQSIYRFRRADPEIFIASRRNAYEMEENKYPVHIHLNQNFRSDSNVIESVNNIFSNVMTETLGDVAYMKGERLIASKPSNDPQPGIEVRIVLENNETEHTEEEEIATLIREMIDNGYLINEYSSDGELTTRMCRYNDFCILMRSRKRATAIEEALKRHAIPVGVDNNENILESSEIMVILALLSVIDNPRREVDMTAVMLSPLFGFTPDDLLAFKNDNPRRDIYSILVSTASEQQENTRISDFLDLLERYRLKASTEPIFRLLIDLLDETDAELLLSAGDRYNERRQNIRKLIDIASTQSDKGNMSLTRFLRILRKGSASLRDSSTYTPSRDAVDIITIHRAKGLEWPIVILADTKHRFNYDDIRKNPVVFDRTMGIGIRHKTEIEGPNSPLALKSTLQFKAIVANQDRKIVSEECRVLYVALTRAKQKIFVTATVKNLENALPQTMKHARPLEYLISETDDFLSWILWGIDEDKAVMLDALKETGEYTDSNISLKLAKSKSIEQPEQQQQSTAIDDMIVDALKHQLNYINPLEKLNQVPVKLSVSELSGHAETIVAPPSFMNEGELTALARGSILHNFMQYADFKQAAKSPEAELERLVTEGFINAEHAKAVNLNQIKAFLESDLGKRLVEGKILREYAFIDSVPATEVSESLPEEFSDESVLIQGIVDCLLFEHDSITLVDYKSDRVSSEIELKDRYTNQLEIYKRAMERCFGRKIDEMYIYSFYLNKAIDM